MTFMAFLFLKNKKSVDNQKVYQGSDFDFCKVHTLLLLFFVLEF